MRTVLDVILSCCFPSFEHFALIPPLAVKESVGLLLKAVNVTADTDFIEVSCVDRVDDSNREAVDLSFNEEIIEVYNNSEELEDLMTHELVVTTGLKKTFG